MLQIAVWGLAGLLAVVSTLPVFIARSGAATGGRGWAWAVAVSGIVFASFLFLAAAEQAGAFDPQPTYPAPAPNDPFITK